MLTVNEINRFKKFLVMNMNQWKSNNLLKKTMFSLNGIYSAFMTENAVRREFAVLVLLVLLAILRGSPAQRVIFIFLACLIPITVELINTSVETIVDLLLGCTYREDVRIAKDMLSAAVMLSLFIGYGISLILLFF